LWFDFCMVWFKGNGITDGFCWLFGVWVGKEGAWAYSGVRELDGEFQDYMHSIIFRCVTCCLRDNCFATDGRDVQYTTTTTTATSSFMGLFSLLPQGKNNNCYPTQTSGRQDNIWKLFIDPELDGPVLSWDVVNWFRQTAEPSAPTMLLLAPPETPTASPEN
jgi:hypothetical protein